MSTTACAERIHGADPDHPRPGQHRRRRPVRRQTVNINITPVNDAPVLTVTGSAAYTENAAPVILDPGLAVSDVDSGSGYSATVQISGGFVAGDQLIGGGTWDAATHTFTTSGHLAPNASLAALQADLRTLGFFSTSDNPGAGPRTLTWTISDGSATFVTTTVVDVTPVNDPAVIAGVTGGAVIEAGGVDNGDVHTPEASGSLTATDVDNPANVFRRRRGERQRLRQLFDDRRRHLDLHTRQQQCRGAGAQSRRNAQ